MACSARYQGSVRRCCVVGLLCVLGCHPCDSVADLRVAGDTPYVRCAQLDPPEEGTRTVAGVELRFAARELTVSPPPTQVAFFRGPAPRGSDPSALFSPLSESGAELLIVLGGVGDDAQAAEATLRALGATGLPTLVLAGGRDEAGIFSEAFADLGDETPQVVDARGLRVVHLGETSLLLLSGAADGRYARSDDACGFANADLEELAGAVPDSGPRYLVSWTAPASELTLGFDRVQAGDPELARWVEAQGLSGSIAAWPALAGGRVRGGEGGQLSAVAPALGAPRARDAEGAVLSDGALVLSRGPRGLAPPSP